MQIVVFEADAWIRASWQSGDPGCETAFVEKVLSPANVNQYRRAAIISTDMSVLSTDLLEKFEDLKLIALRSTGVDLIDLGYCRHRGITVCNVPAYAQNAVAEHVFALLLAISRRLVEAVTRTRRSDFSWQGLQAFELRDKTLAVFGTGAIGRRVAQIAGGFGMHIVAYDVKPDQSWADATGIPYRTLEDALRLADIVSLHVPATPQTHYLLSDDEFSLMKDGAVVINTARGDLIDPLALLRALSSGKLAAAGLDVLPQEHAIWRPDEQLATLIGQGNKMQTLLANLMLLKHPKVIVTPHVGFFSKEAARRLVEITQANIEAFVRGKIQNAVLPH